MGMHATFHFAQLAIRILMLLLIYPALVKVAEKTIADDPAHALLHIAVLFGIAVLANWKSKALAAQLVDIVRKPMLKGKDRQ